MSSSSKISLANYLLGQSSGSVFGKNYVKNAIALQNVANVTASGTATVSRNTTTPLTAIADFSISLPNNATDYVEWSLDTLDNALKGQNCELRFDYTASSVGSNVVAQIYQGSNKIAESLPLAINSNSTVVSLNAPCGDLSSATTVRIANGTGNSGTSAIKAANVSYGKASNIGSVAQAEMFGTVTMNSCSGGGLSTSSTSYTTVSSSGCSYTSTGKISSPPSNTFGATIASLPPGEYEIEADGYIQNNGNDACFVRFTDGTNSSSEMYFRSTTSTIFPKISGRLRYTTAQSNINIQLQFKAGGTNSCFVFAPTQFRLKRFPLESEIAYRPELQALSWSGYHTTSASWSTTSSSFVDPTVSGTPSISETSNTNFGSVTTAAGNLPGITFTPKKTGKYYACARVILNNDTSSGSAVAKLTDSAGSVTFGTGQIYGSNSSNLVRQEVCGHVVVSSLSPVTLKIMLKGNGTGSAVLHQGQDRGTEWSIFALDQNIPAPVLVGGVTSSYLGVSNLEWAKVTSTCSTSPCTISSQSSSSWITNITRSSAGTYQANFPSGYSMAHCWVSGLGSTINSSYGNATLPTATTYNFTTISNGSATDSQFELFCLMTR